MFWEADEVGRALVQGAKEGSKLDLEESILIMEVMDEIRRQGGLRSVADPKCQVSFNCTPAKRV